METNNKKCKFELLIHKACKSKFMDCFKKRLNQGEDLYLKEIDDVFNEIDDVYHNREKYSIEWAFEDAQNKLNRLGDEILECKLKPKFLKHSSNSQLKGAFEDLMMMNRGLEKKAKWYLRLFSNMYILLSMVEIIISLILVIGLSNIGSSKGMFINSTMLSILFIGIITFLNITLEKYLIKPKINIWGWELYSRTSQKMRRMIAISLFTYEEIFKTVEQLAESDLVTEMHELNFING